MAHYPQDNQPVVILARELGRKIEAFRLSQNMRQDDVARMTGLSRSTIVRVESGKGGTIDSLIRIVKALGIEERLDNLVPDARISPLEKRDEPQMRQRARPGKTDGQSETWTWGDE